MAYVSDIQKQILLLIKQYGEISISKIAEELGVSYEAVRQQLRQLTASGLIAARVRRNEAIHAGRPTAMYRLSTDGEHFFPKAYDELAVEIVDTLTESLGTDALRRVFTAITDDKVEQWTAKLEGKPLADRLEALKQYYLEDDLYTEVDTSGDIIRLIERNCPFLNVATRRPAICSITVSTLSRLLGFKVTRERRFQNGDGLCAFVIHTDTPIDPKQFRFEFEDGVFPISPGDQEKSDLRDTPKLSRLRKKREPK